jgi:hypothetical protein
VRGPIPGYVRTSPGRMVCTACRSVLSTSALARISHERGMKHRNALHKPHAPEQCLAMDRHGERCVRERSHSGIVHENRRGKFTYVVQEAPDDDDHGAAS